MSVVSLTLKSLGVCTIGGAAAVGGIFVFSPELLGFKKNIDGDAFLMASTEAPVVAAASENVNDGTKTTTEDITYKCKLLGSENSSADCTVFLVKSAGDKNQLNLSDIKKNENFQNVTSNSSFVQNKLYKIVVSQSFVTEATNAINKKIEVLTQDEKTKIASLNVLFGASSNVETFHGKTKYFLGQAKTFTASPAATSLTKDANTFKCSLDNATAAANSKLCKIFDFTTPSDATAAAETKHSSLTFSKASQEATKVDQHKFYLIEFVNDDDAQTISTTNSQNSIYSHVFQSSGSVATTGVTKIQFDSVKPLVITSESTKRALIFSTEEQ